MGVEWTAVHFSEEVFVLREGGIATRIIVKVGEVEAVDHGQRLAVELSTTTDVYLAWLFREREYKGFIE